MSIVYYISEEEENSYLQLLSNSTLRENIRVDYVIQTDPSFFPINYLRNRAIQNVVTSHFWLADMDVWPTCSFP